VVENQKKPAAKKRKNVSKSGNAEKISDKSCAEKKKNAASAPVAHADGSHVFDLSDSQWYLNRELTWLEFNNRVLHEAEDKRTPLLERVKFLAIVSANLDEFFMKRIGGLKQQIGAGVKELTLDGRTARQQVTECHAVIRGLEARKESAYRAVIGQLVDKNILIESYSAIT